MYRALRALIMVIFKAMYRLRYEGLENIPQDGAYIYASNHRSYTDPVVITLPVKLRFAYMAKEELFHKNFFFTAIIRFMGAFPVERGKGDNTVITDSVSKLKAGRNLIIFPEGTRSYDGKVGRGKSGVALIAAMAGVDVVPVGIIFKGEKLEKHGDILVKFGKPIPAAELAVSGNSTGEVRAVKMRIMAEITALVEGENLEA